MRTAILLVAIVGLLAMRAMAPQPQGFKILPLPDGEYSLKDSQIWQISGDKGNSNIPYEFDIAADGEGRSPVLTGLANCSLEIYEGNAWALVFNMGSPGNEISFKPGFLLPTGHYRIVPVTGRFGHLTGYWSRPSTTNYVHGQDTFLPQSRLWKFHAELDNSNYEFTIPGGGTYLLRTWNHSILRRIGNEWVEFVTMPNGVHHQIEAPGVRLPAGQYSSTGYAMGYIALP